jgi:hypothetical protein
MPPHYWLLAGSAYDTFEFSETKSVLERRELPAKKLAHSSGGHFQRARQFSKSWAGLSKAVIDCLI